MTNPHRAVGCRRTAMLLRYLIICWSLALAGCSALQWDSGVSWAPDFVKQDQPKPSSVEPAPLPDVIAIVQKQGAHTFSNLQSIQVSEPWPDDYNWKFCTKVYTLGVTGVPIIDTYTLDVIGERLHNPRLDRTATCAKLRYRSVPTHATDRSIPQHAMLPSVR